MAAAALLLLLATSPPSPSAAPAEPQQTSSPSEGTATVSPVTAAVAVSPDTRASFGVDLSAGASIAGGDFGSARDTSILATAFAARAHLGNFRVSASIPYMRIRSAGSIVTGIDSTPVVIAADTGGRRRTVDGIGDLTLGASYTIDTSARGPELELSGRVKLPTASDSSDLSTGKTDYSVGAQITQTIGRFSPFVSATYRIFGDPKGYNLRNGFAASAGFSFSPGSRTTVLASYHYAATASDLVRDAHELFAGASRSIGRGMFRLTAFATAGLSQGAPSESGGLGLSVSL